MMNPIMALTLLQREGMRTALLLLLSCGLLSAGQGQWFINFDDSGLEGWHVPLPKDWEIANDGANKVLRLREPMPIGEPRRPVKFALFQPGCVSDFEAEVKMRRAGKSLIVAFGFQDRAHFYYAHVSSDSGDHQVHNGIFKVDGGERVRVAGKGSAPALPTDGWHTVRVVRSPESGDISVFVDKDKTARFQLVDKSFVYGWVGLGSFDETGDFDDFRLRGTPSDKCQADRISPLDP